MPKGLNEVLRNLEKAGNQAVQEQAKRMDKAGVAVKTHIADNYTDRSIHGKGFESRSGDLGRSLDNSVISDGKTITGVIHAGTDYAPHVENISGGKYAFMQPGLNDMRKTIWDILKGD